MMPWLQFATYADPQNIEAYLVAAFWLRRGGELSAAEKVLKSAAENNPKSYKIYQSMGLNYLHKGELLAAANAFRLGRECWPSEEDPTNPGAQQDLAQILTFQGALFEFEGELQKAVENYEYSLSLFPDRGSLKERILAINNQEDVESFTIEFIENMFKRHDSAHLQGGGSGNSLHQDHSCHEHDHDHENH